MEFAKYYTKHHVFTDAFGDNTLLFRVEGKQTQPDRVVVEPPKTLFQRIAGGYCTDEVYVYVRGRGRGRYVCDRCGIRCKKPSMLKKHIRLTFSVM